MNVIRPHPTYGRGRGKIVRKSHNDINVFRTVRAGTRASRKPNENDPIPGVESIGSSSLSRLQLSVQRSTSCTTSGGMSVARILGHQNAPFSNNTNSKIHETSVQPSSQLPQLSSACEDLMPAMSEAEEPSGERFFENMMSGSNWANEGEFNLNNRQSSQREMNFPFPTLSQNAEANPEGEGTFFAMEHVLQDNHMNSYIPTQETCDDEEPESRTSVQLTENQEYDTLFKTPLPLSTGEVQQDDYELIFNIQPNIYELPRLSTPLFSSKIGSESTPSGSKSGGASNRVTRATKTTLDCPSSVSSGGIIALTEGRGYAVGEVGLAFLDLNKPILTLCQISDGQTYAKALTKINLFNPVELVVPDTFTNDKNSSDLFKRVIEYFTTIKVVSVKRIYFNGEQGLDVVRSLCLPEYASIDIITIRKYYALSAAAALLKYIEHEHNTIYAKESIQVCYEGASGVVAIDMATSKRLELVRTHGNMINSEKYSLMGVMDSTVTLGGKRRLRTEILQPPASEQIVEKRLDVVSFLVSNPSQLASIQACLVKFCDAEKLMWLCRKTPNLKQEKKTNELMTNYVLLLKSSLENVPPLQSILSESENDFLIELRDRFSDQRFQQMVDMVSQKIHHDVKLSKGYQASEVNRCFSIKEEVNGLLDVARSTYSKLVGEIQDQITKLADEHNLPLRMAQSAELGFHGQYMLPKNRGMITEQIPSIFTDVKIKGNFCHVSTDEMFALNVRVRRAVQEIQLISNVVLFELIKELRPLVGCLYNLCENVSILDVICSLAKYSLTPNFVRPTFSDQLNIQAGRHPILDHIHPIKPTPNDVFASKNKNLNILTGPNMSGKTVYLLQVALLQIMAQMGSFVPAEKAEFRITDHIYVRKDGNESVENKTSAFTVEVKEVMYCLKTMSETSLIILDELCTNTNNEGGTAIAWAICEELVCQPAFTFISTHLHFLTNFEKIFVNVTNYHMEAIENGESGSPYSALTYTHRLLKGVTQISNYGLRLMMSTSLPEAMKKEATRVVEALTSKRSNCLAVAKKISIDVQQVMSRVDKLEHFMKDLYELSKSESYSLDSVQALQRHAVDTIIVEEIRSQVLNEPGTPPTQCQQPDHSSPPRCQQTHDEPQDTQNETGTIYVEDTADVRQEESNVVEEKAPTELDSDDLSSSGSGSDLMDENSFSTNEYLTANSIGSTLCDTETFNLSS